MTATCKECLHYNVCYKKPIRNVDEDLVVIGGCSDYKPAADVVEVKHGEWLANKGYKHAVCFCSICNHGMPFEERGDYCPNCGADMRGNDNRKERKSK